MLGAGNVAIDSLEARDELLSTPIVEKIVDILKPKTLSLELLRVTCWTMASLCRGSPYPPFSSVSCPDHELCLR